MNARTAIAALVILSGLVGASAEVRTQDVNYSDGRTALKGRLVWDDRYAADRPGVLVFPAWWGIDDHAEKRAEALARRGYVALVADVYGRGRSTMDKDRASEWSAPYRRDRKLARSRAAAALKQLRRYKQVDDDKIAAIGFSFGGMVALELARSGADIGSVIAFHAPLDTHNLQDAKNIKAQILVCHGGADPQVPVLDVMTFIKEMEIGEVRWQLNIYGKAPHAFTNPRRGRDASEGVAYDHPSARRALEAMKIFLAETVGDPTKPESDADDDNKKKKKDDDMEIDLGDRIKVRF